MDSPEQTAVRLLAQRALSVHELRERLARRGHGPDAVAQAVEAMQRYRYVDDDALAHSVARAAGARGRGPRWVEQTLRRRGLASPLAERAAALAYANDADALTCARALVARRNRRPASDSAARTRAMARDFRFLLARGFSPTVARAALAGPTPYEEDP